MYKIRKENSPNFVFMFSLTKCVEQEGVIFFWVYRHKNLSILKPLPPPQTPFLTQLEEMQKIKIDMSAIDR